jgi:hypothetical protein
MKRKMALAREMLAGKDDDDLVKAMRELGSPPVGAVQSIIWGNRVVSLVTWAAAVGPMSAKAMARRRGILDAIKAMGLTNSKAVDKQIQKQVMQRLGVTEADPEAELEPIDEDADAEAIRT